MCKAWKRQLWEATCWTEIRGRAGAVFCEMKGFGVTVPSWQVFRMRDGRLIGKKDTDGKDVYW